MRIIIQDTKHLKLRQDLLWVGTATLVTVIIWVVYAVYTAFNQTTIDASVEKLLTPLNPSLDQAALATVDDRFEPPESFTVLVVNPDDDSHTPVALGQIPLTPSEPSSPSSQTTSLPVPTPQPTSGTGQNLF